MRGRRWRLGPWGCTGLLAAAILCTFVLAPWLPSLFGWDGAAAAQARLAQSVTIKAPTLATALAEFEKETGLTVEAHWRAGVSPGQTSRTTGREDLASRELAFLAYEITGNAEYYILDNGRIVLAAEPPQVMVSENVRYLLGGFPSESHIPDYGYDDRMHELARNAAVLGAFPRIVDGHLEMTCTPADARRIRRLISLTGGGRDNPLWPD